MAGRGTRLRPHTNTIPKPLLKLCGKSIIEWIVEEIKISTNNPIEEIHFIIGEFGKEVEKLLINTAEKIGSKGFIHYQHEALGTAHAIYCAKEALQDVVFVVFADTIFKGKINIDKNVDGIIWTMLVDNPEKYGVVRKDENDIISEFVEKPKNFVSKNAIVGLYYFKEAQKLKFELQHLIENNLRENNEFQLTNCLETLKAKGDILKCAELEEWLDCGNKNELLATNSRIVEISGIKNYIAETSNVINSKIKGFSTIEENVIIENSDLDNCIVFEGAEIKNSKLNNSIIGSFCKVNNAKGRMFLGDHSEYEGI